MADDDTPKPEDQASERKTSHAILLQEIRQGTHEYQRPTLGLWLSGVAAGLEIGFSVLLMAVVITSMGGTFSEPTVHLFVANMYAVGFILVMLGRSELFTEHTTLAVLPVLSKHFPVTGLVRVWVTIYSGNLLGAAVFSGLLVLIAPARDIVEHDAFAKIAADMTGHPWWVILLSAMLAGWLMGEMGWCVAAARDTISQIVCVWIIAAAIGFAKLHHCIVGTVEVLAGVWTSPDLGAADFAHFLLWTTLGNILGGVIFVGLIKYGHASRAGAE